VRGTYDSVSTAPSTEAETIYIACIFSEIVNQSVPSRAVMFRSGSIVALSVGAVVRDGKCHIFQLNSEWTVNHCYNKIKFHITQLKKSGA
jgi:hypothetical protein